MHAPMRRRRARDGPATNTALVSTSLPSPSRRRTAAAAGKEPSRLPGALELVIVLCLAVTAGFRLAAAAHGRRRNGTAVAMLFLTTLAAAVACLRPSLTPHTVRIPLNLRHTAGLAVGSLCLPTLTAALLACGHEGARQPLWLCMAASFVFLMAQIFTSATGLSHVALVRAFKCMQRALAMSSGEMCIAVEGLALVAHAAATRLPWRSVAAVLGVRRPAYPLPAADLDGQVQVVVEVLVFGCMVAAGMLVPVLRRYAQPNFTATQVVPSVSASPDRRRNNTTANNPDTNTDTDADPDPAASVLPPVATAVTAGVLLGVVVLVETPWLALALGQHPFVWVAGVLVNHPVHLAAVAYWVVVLVAVVRLAPTHTTSALPNIVVRKFFHFVAVAMFAPVLLVSPSMMRLAFVVALKVMVYLEVLRCLRAPRVGPALHAFMKPYLDARDSGYVILTHLYLILGCAVTMWLPSPPAAAPGMLLPATGLLVLGVGDAAAATVGKLVGRCRWPGTPKTLEGTAAAMVSVCVVAGAMGVVTPHNAGAFVVAAAVVSLLETFTKQVDNLVLPLYFYASLLILAPPLVT